MKRVKISNPEDFGNYLRESREKLGWTQAQIARKLGYSTPQFISNWERGLSCPPLKVLNEVADIYKLKIDDLFEHILALTLFSTEKSLRQEYGRHFSKGNRSTFRKVGNRIGR